MWSNNLTKVTHQLIQLTLTFLIFIKTHSRKNKATTNMQINVNLHAKDSDKWNKKLIHDQYKKVQNLYSVCQGSPQNRVFLQRKRAFKKRFLQVNYCLEID